MSMSKEEFTVEALLDAIEKARTRPLVGTPANPYEVVVPKWYEAMCIEQGTTPQEVYDRVFGESSFRHGRVTVVEPM
jgi:hypothetical protein